MGAGLTLSEARRQGAAYYQGKPCLRGHSGVRRTSSGYCTVCERASNVRWRANNVDKARSAIANWAKRNPEVVRAAKVRWVEKHPGRQGELCRRWVQNNPGRAAALSAKRHAAKMQRFPIWADEEKIAAVYAARDLATARTGVPHDVDHILPLQGKKISGLHVHTNLQVLPARENQRKSAKFEPC